MMLAHRARYAFAIATAVVASGAVTNSAWAQSPNRAPLVAAVAAAPGGTGWRTVTLSDGHVAAIGADAASGPMRVVGIACGASKRPEIAAEARGGAPFPRALLLDGGDDMLMSFPITAGEATPSGLDALVFGPPGEHAKMWLDQQPFPTADAEAAIRGVAADCEQRSGWEYGKDDEKQLLWMLNTQGDAPPSLVFGKPETGWVVAVLSCERGKGVTLRSTALPRGAKSGQSMPLSVQVDNRKFSTAGRVELLEGDVPGFVVAAIKDPRPLLDALANGKVLTLRSRSEQSVIPARGVGPLIPRFRDKCRLS